MTLEVSWRHLRNGAIVVISLFNRSEGAHAMADLLRTLQTLATEKQSILTREEKLVTGLRHVLGRLGYQLEALPSNGASRPNGKASRSQRAHGALRVIRRISCPECSRTFALPLHLGRHMSVMHKGMRLSTGDASQIAQNGSVSAAPAKTQVQRRRMSPAARQAAARRMKAYWRKRKSAQKGKAGASRDSRISAARAARPSPRRKAPKRPPRRAA